MSSLRFIGCGFNPGQVTHTLVPLSPNSMMWHWHAVEKVTAGMAEQ